MKFTLLVALGALSVASAIEMDCTYSVPGAHFDLSELSKRAPIEVEGGDLDWTKEKEEVYRYQVGVCRTITKQEMTQFSQVCNTEGEVPAAVYQSGPVGDESCHVAGQVSSTLKFQLTDAENPAHGLKLTYRDGSECHHTRDFQKCGGSTGVKCPNREVDLYFVCKDTEVSPGQAAEVDQTGQITHCKYSIEIQTLHACPQECGHSFNEERGELALCAGHGLCGWDKSNKKAKCFCDDGYMGTDCSTKGTPSTSSGGVKGLVILLLLLTIGLIAVIVFMAKQVRAYRADATNYMQIRGQELSDQMSTI